MDIENRLILLHVQIVVVMDSLTVFQKRKFVQLAKCLE